MKKTLPLILVLATSVLAAQQPQTQTAPIFPVNAKYTNGVAPGYAPTAGSGLTLNLGAGTANCSGTIVTYAPGTLTMTASTTNYVYLDTSGGCDPDVKTSAFTAIDMPIAVVVAGSSTLTSIADVRTMFQQTTAAGSGISGASALTINCIPKAVASTLIDDSSICDDGTTVTTPEPVTALGFNSSDTSQNGFRDFTSVGTLPATPGSNTVRVTVPNSVTPYMLELPGAQPPDSTHTVPSCTNANPSVCSWTTGSGLGGGAPPNVVYATTGDTISTLTALCTSQLTSYVTTVHITLTLTANTALPSCLVPVFQDAGQWTIAGGFQLTSPNQIVDLGALKQHINISSGSLITNQAIVPTEWFGAAVSASASANLAAMQQCIASLNFGQCTINFAGGYQINGSLAFTKSNTGFAGSNAGFGTPVLPYGGAANPSYLLETSATAHIITAIGTSGNHLNNNRFENFSVARSVQPTTGSVGFDIEFTFYALFDHVMTLDSFDQFYLKGTANTKISNSYGLWGENGLGSYSGTFNGINLDTSAGDLLDSTQADDVILASTLASATIRGVYDHGSIVADFVAHHIEGAGLAYGAVVDDTSADSNGSASFDVHFHHCIFDGASVSAYLFNNIKEAQKGSIEVDGGEASSKGDDGSPTIDIENSSGVNVHDIQLSNYNNTPNAYVYIHGGGANNVNNIITHNPQNASIVAIWLDSTGENSISNLNLRQHFPGETSNIAVKLTTAVNNMITGIIGEYGATGITADSASTGNMAFVKVASNYTTPFTDADSTHSNFWMINGKVYIPGLSGTAAICANGTGNFLTQSGCVAGGFANPMTTLGDSIYGGASGAATRLAGPTTTAHQFIWGDVPVSSAAVAPAWFDLGANLGTYVKATSPIVATQNANDVTLSCPTCGTSTSTAVNNNGASTLGTSQQDGMLPYICADSSGSAAAQTCNTATSFTVTSGNCFMYKTTTTNSGTGLTLNPNSLGAKSLAIPGSSGWTTTLTASIIPANKPMPVCYDGTNLNVMQTGTASAGGSSSSAFPLAVVQDLYAQSGGSNVTSFTVTFPQTTASSGNTSFIIVATDGSQTITLPTGWTADLNQLQLSFSRIILLHKTTASDTSATFTTSSGTSFAAYFFEVAGSRSLDQSSTGGVANTTTIKLPSITPTAGAAVFGFAAGTSSNGNAFTAISAATSMQAPVAGPWKPITNIALSTSGRFFSGLILQQASDGTAIAPPLINYTSTVSLFSSGGIAYATFSIK